MNQIDNHKAAPLTLVVGIQDDITGLDAWRRAEALALASDDVQLHLCHCVGEAGEDAAEKLTTGENLLGEWAAKKLFGTDLILQSQIHVGVGKPADVLRQLAVDVEADMIVVGTHNKGALRRVVDGSVVHELLADSPCSVVVAKPNDHEGRKKSPKIASPPAGETPRQLGKTHQYGYRRSVKLNFPRSAFGLGDV